MKKLKYYVILFLVVLITTCLFVSLYFIKIYLKPTVSVIISSYNMAATLPAAIESIINQTYKNWELIVINDGSTDKTSEVLLKYLNNPKIHIINNETNIGLANSLNKGLKVAKGKYIARLDADDISFPTRLERQVTLMTFNNIDLLGNKALVLNIPDNYRYPKLLRHNEVALILFTRNIFIHSTVMIRKSFLDKNNLSYSNDYPNAEDYNLWIDIFKNGGKMAIFGGEPVSIYNPSLHSQEWLIEQKNSSKIIKANLLLAFSPDIIEKYGDNVLNCSNCELIPFLIQGNKNLKLFDQKWLINYQKINCEIK